MRLKTLLMGVLTLVIAISALGFVACAGQEPVQEPTTVTVKFDVNTTHQTNNIKDKVVTIGKRVSRPRAYIISDNPTNLQLYGWYTTPDCTTQWDFKNDRASKDMTLYAKWVELYEVSYYLNGAFVKTDPVFNGDYIEEDATIAEGYKYLGSYADENFETKFDFNAPISASTNVYVKRSSGIYLSDDVQEGELSSGSLSYYLAAYLGTYTEGAEEGWVEEYTVTTNYASGSVEEKCSYVNFGYAPDLGDSYVEIYREYDITDSQIIRVWFKNLGPASEVCMYFTTMLDPEKGIYSETGPNYTQDYCYPNYTGSNASVHKLTSDQIGMDESDEWTYVDFNLYEIYKNGYSVWGTSPYLGSLRFQVNYKNTSEDDWSNVFLIKAIEGISCDVAVEDSQEVTQLLQSTKEQTEQEIEQVASAQQANANGFVFPKDASCVSKTVGNSQVYGAKEGLMFYSENEILGREQVDPSTGFTITAPEGKNIDLGENTTLDITLKNLGYASDMIVYVYNDQGVPVKTEITIGTNMAESKTYSVNLYGKFGMEGNLRRIEILYNSVGVDNLLIIEGVGFGEFRPYDIVGINFNDKKCYGFTSSSEVAVSFDDNREGTLFEVGVSGASLTSTDKEYKATNDGYSYATLEYYLHADSNLTAVTAQYKIDGEFASEYRYQLDTANKGVVNKVTLPLVLDERGFVQALKLTFEGTGRVIIKKISYEVGETGLPYYKSYRDVFVSFPEWFGSNLYEYDSINNTSVLIKGNNSSLIASSIYIGYTANHSHIGVPHTTQNVLVTPTTVVKVVYQNRCSENTMNLILSFDKTPTAPGDGSGIPLLEAYNLAIDSEMAEYEWSTLTLEVPTQFVDNYLAKITLQFAGKEIAIRAISIETE